MQHSRNKHRQHAANHR